MSNYTFADLDALITYHEARTPETRQMGIDIRDALWGIREAGEYRRLRLAAGLEKADG